MIRKMQPQATSAPDQSLQTLLLPLDGFHLIVPQSTIVEITPFPKLTRNAEASAWLLGLFEWRAEQVPLISFEGLSGTATAVAKNGPCVAVLYTLKDRAGFEYYAIALAAIPRPAQLNSSSLPGAVETGGANETIAADVSIGGNRTVIPDLERIEQLIQAELRRFGNDAAERAE
ncbi:MAG: chemotaxis protein CheW [Gammaproteobacteria bacterium]